MDALARIRRSVQTRTAKTCGPDPPTLGSTPGSRARGDGGYQARYARESTEQPLKPLCREGRRCSGSPVVLPPCFLLHGAHGCNRHPAFPAPSEFQGGNALAKPGQIVPQECEVVAVDCRMGTLYTGMAKDRSPVLTIFCHCGRSPFSSRTTPRRVGRQRTVNGFGRQFWRLSGSGNADSQQKVRSSGWSGRGRPCSPGCVGAHPPSWRASASYRPLRAVWAVCAWALRGCARTPKPFSAHTSSASIQKEASQ